VKRHNHAIAAVVLRDPGAPVAGGCGEQISERLERRARIGRRADRGDRRADDQAALVGDRCFKMRVKASAAGRVARDDAVGQRRRHVCADI
jgi:hypothetical protein